MISTMTMSASKLQNQGQPTAVIVMVECCAVTGNIILNQEQAGEFNFAHSPVFFPGPPVPGGMESKGAGVAITSDTFGTPSLPPRPPFTPPPTDRWEFVMNLMYKCRGLCLASTPIRNPLPESASASSTDTSGCMTISPSMPSVACPLPSKERSSRPFSCQGTA